MNNFSTKLISSICTFWLITNTALALEVGDQAPDFLLQATDGKTYSLSEFKGEKSVVLAWFPQAFTSGCTIECKSLAENGHLIQEYNAQYFMISVDDIEVNTAFAIEHNADFPLLSDPSKQTAMDYQVLASYGLANRHTFYIGQDGKILKIDRRINPSTSAEDIAVNLETLGVSKISN